MGRAPWGARQVAGSEDVGVAGLRGKDVFNGMAGIKALIP